MSKDKKQIKKEEQEWFNLGKLSEELDNDNLDQYSINKTGDIKFNVTGNLLSPRIEEGYHRVTINKKAYRVHRLVAKMFIKNDDLKKIQINHIDGNKSNNSIENLEWCTAGENIKHACEEGLLESQGRAVNQIDHETKKVIKTFDDMQLAGKKLNIRPTSISRVCKLRNEEKKILTCGGFEWEYVDKNWLVKEKISNSTKLLKIPGFDNYGLDKQEDGTYKVYSFLRKRYLEKTMVNGKNRYHPFNNDGKRCPMIIDVIVNLATKNPAYHDIDHKIKNTSGTIKKTNKQSSLCKMDTKKETDVKEELDVELEVADIPNFSDFSITEIQEGRYDIYDWENDLTVKQTLTNDWFIVVTMINDCGNSKDVFMHDIVATAFIKNDNPKIKTHVIHIDGNSLNNTVTNLKWCSSDEYTQHWKKVDNKLIKKFKPSKPVKQIQSDKSSQDSEDEKLVKKPKLKLIPKNPKQK